MEGGKKGESGMIQWYWVLIAWVIGEAMGIAEMAICSGNWDNIQIKEKAEDAATSTAAQNEQKG